MQFIDYSIGLIKSWLNWLKIFLKPNFLSLDHFNLKLRFFFNFFKLILYFLDLLGLLFLSHLNFGRLDLFLLLFAFNNDLLCYKLWSLQFRFIFWSFFSLSKFSWWRHLNLVVLSKKWVFKIDFFLHELLILLPMVCKSLF